jgi:hypothetical protein
MGLLGWITNSKPLLDSAAKTYLESLVRIFFMAIMMSMSEFARANSSGTLLQILLFTAVHDRQSPEDFKSRLNSFHQMVNIGKRVGLAHVCMDILRSRSYVTNPNNDTFNAIGKYLEKSGGTTEQGWGEEFSEGDFQNAVNTLRNIARNNPGLMNTPVQTWLEKNG